MVLSPLNASPSRKYKNATHKAKKMPRNVEIKALVADLKALCQRASALSGSDGTLLVQKDTFFEAPNARLKLRSVNGESELIAYSRPDAAGPKMSDFNVTAVSDAGSLQTTLAMALGEIGTVSKRRRLFMIGQTRVHCDDVDGLGSFMELEVCLSDDQTTEDGAAIANDLMVRLGISESDLVVGAYLDQLKAKQPSK